MKKVKSVELQMSFNDAFDLCVRSLSQIKRSKIKEKSRSQGRIVAKGGISIKSFGEVIEFKLKEISCDKTGIELSSRPTVPITLVDYGKNRANIEKLVTFLTQGF